MSSNIDESSTALPEGYLAITGPDDEEYVVPDFMVPALHQMFDGYRKKLDLHAFRRAGAVHENNSEAFGVIGEGKIMAPTVPGSSDRERLSAHSEVLALQDRLGISYKDAAHRLYMAEVEKLMAEEKTHKAFTNVKISIEQALERAYNSIKEVEKQ